MPYALREAAAAFRRTPLLTLLSVVAVAFSLFVVGLFGLTAHNIRRAIERIEERVEVVAYLRDDASEQQVRLMQEEMRLLPEVLEVRYVSKTEALATAVNEMEEFRDVFSDLEVNPLPASLELRLKPGARNPASVERVAKSLRAYPFVEDVRFGRDWLGKIVSLRRIAGGAATIIGGAFAAVAAIIIATAVRIAVFARREEISIMRLVGATDAFVRRPFLLEGVATGLLGGVAAAGLAYTAFRLVDAVLIRIEWLPLPWVVAGVIAGAGFGLISSGIAVRRHLRAV
ncbi:MAG TPA: permease-like cell division protein FtsX [Longimicrobiaceae bacterium]|nr:permease-like cell division protein FtsX [Longimicrobiaceae bacterium]